MRRTVTVQGIPKWLLHETSGGGPITGTTYSNVTALSPEDGKEQWNAFIEGEVLGLALSPDGTRVAACGKGNRFAVFKTDSGLEAWRKPTGSSTASRFRWTISLQISKINREEARKTSDSQGNLVDQPPWTEG